MSKTPTAVWPLSGFGDEIDPDPARAGRRAAGPGRQPHRGPQRLGHQRLRARAGAGCPAQGNPRREGPQGLGRRQPHRQGGRQPAGGARAGTPPPDHLRGQGRWTPSTSASSPSTGPRPRAPEDIRDDVLARMGALAALAAEAGVVLLHENEKGIYGDTPRARPGHHGDRGLPGAAHRVGQRQLRPGGRQALHRRATPCCAPTSSTSRSRTPLAATGEVVPSGEGDGELDATIAALKADGFSRLRLAGTAPGQRPRAGRLLRARWPSASRPAPSPRSPRKNGVELS